MDLFEPFLFVTGADALQATVAGAAFESHWVVALAVAGVGDAALLDVSVTIVSAEGISSERTISLPNEGNFVTLGIFRSIPWQKAR